MPRDNNVCRIVKASAARLRRSVASGRVHIQTQDHDFLGLRAGDILLWEGKAEPAAGDLILVEPIESVRSPVTAMRPAIFLAMRSRGVEESGSRGESNGGQPERSRIIEWTALWEERCLEGRVVGVVTHVIIPEVGIAALDLELEVPDSAGPSFKVLIDSVRLFGTMLRRRGFPFKVARMERGSARMQRIIAD